MEPGESETVNEIAERLQRQLNSQLLRRDQEISQLNTRMNEMNGLMRDLFGQLNLIATATQRMSARNPTEAVDPTPEAGGSHPDAPPNASTTAAPRQEPVGEVTQDDNHEADIVTKSQVEDLISQRVKAVIAYETAEQMVGKGRPYPVEYDQVQYPKGYVVPKFNAFSGTENPRQHLAQFKATCGNTGGNDALLLRQFVSSLTHTAFEWYAELPNDSIRTFAEMETLFVKRFAGATRKVTITDLALERRKKEESVTRYITRWRNLSMKCDQQLTEKHAVELLMGNIDDQMAPYLAMATINTFQELLDRVARFERLPKSKGFNPSSSNNAAGRGRQTRFYDQRKDDVNTTFAFTVEKKNNEGASTSRPSAGPANNRRKNPTLQQKMDKQYSFKKECTAKIFRHALKLGLKLPEPRRPEQVDRTEDPSYCPYHRFLGHTIEDCFVFKDWVERSYQKGELTLSDSVLVNPKKQGVNVVTARSSQDTTSHVETSGARNMQDETQQEEEDGWETFISRKTKRMINILLAIKAVRWRSSLEPELIPEFPLPRRRQFLYEQRKPGPSQTPPTKPRKARKRRSRKSKSDIQKLIDSLEEYEQPPRRPVKLEEYMVKLNLDAENPDEEVVKETCRVITLHENVFGDDSHPQVEACYAVDLLTDSDDELCFPEENPTWANAREIHPNLGSDSEGFESSGDSQDSESSFSEDLVEGITQIQLRSGRQIFPPLKKASVREKEVEINEDALPPLPPKPQKTNRMGVDYNVLAHLRKLPALLSIYDALMLSDDIRETLVKALQNPEQYEAFFAEERMKEDLTSEKHTVITFSDDDLLLGTFEHNRPLYVTAQSNAVRIKRILIDPGASVNLLTVKTLRALALDARYLDKSRVFLQGFNE